MPKRIPIKAARQISEDFKCPQVVVMAWDGKKTHCVTYGKSVEDCDQAALGGDRIKKALGWPESLNEVPSRVKKLQARTKELEAELKGTR